MVAGFPRHFSRSCRSSLGRSASGTSHTGSSIQSSYPMAFASAGKATAGALRLSPQHRHHLRDDRHMPALLRGKDDRLVLGIDR